MLRFSFKQWFPTVVLLVAVALSLLLALAVTADEGGAQGQDTVGSQLVIRATGSAGDEIMAVEIDGQVMRQYRLHQSDDFWSAPQYRSYFYTHPTAFSLDDVRVLFRNDGFGPGGVDRNIRVDWFQLGGTVVQAESSSVISAGAWANGSCSPLKANFDEALVCSGFYAFGADDAQPEPPEEAAEPSTVEVYAAGLEGSEEIFLEIDGSSVVRYELPQSPNFWSSSPEWSRFAYEHDEAVAPGQVRVLFNNDLYVEDQLDRNVKVQRIVIDGASHPTTDPSVVSLGTLQGNSCEVAGRFQTDLLNCRGFFQFAGGTDIDGDGPRLQVREVVADVDTPWDLGFLPDGSMLFTERPGRLGIRDTNGQVRPVQADLSDVVEEGNAGLMSLVIDPAFLDNRRFYTCQSQRTNRFSIVVVAWELSADGGSATRIGEPLARVRQDPGHGGCRARFDGDGYLVVGSGDAFEGSAPQDLSRLAGKTYRIDRFTGEPAPGNPFLDSANPQTRKIWTYGHRNVQGLALRPGTDDMWSVEHGPDVDDEVNLLVGGGNYGWDPVPIPGFTPEIPGYEQERNPMTDFAKFPDAQAARWSSGDPTVAPSGAVFLEGEKWGAYEGALAMLTLKDSRLRLLFFDDAGELVDQIIPIELAGTFGRLRSPVLGPDGDLYITTSNSSSGDNRDDVILRVTPQ